MDEFILWGFPERQQNISRDGWNLARVKIKHWHFKNFSRFLGQKKKKSEMVKQEGLDVLLQQGQDSRAL